MLKLLQITNYALIDNLTIEFGNNLNIFTGETGAGKSIIVDALMLLFGERASSELVRDNSNKAIIEGSFNIGRPHPIFEILEQQDVDLTEDIIIRREILKKGSSRSFINDTPIPLSILKEIGESLVDFHGQYEHQSLLKIDNHLTILDATGNYKDLLSNYKNLYQIVKNLLIEIQELEQKNNELHFISEKLLKQYNEIDQINPKPKEDEELNHELKILENSETIYNLLTSLISISENDNNALIPSLVKFKKIMQDLTQIDTKFRPFLEEIEPLIVSINEITRFAESYLAEITFDEHKLENIRQRLVDIRALIRKYGSLENAINEKERIRDELEKIENLSLIIQKKKNEFLNLKKQLTEIAIKLTESRQLHSVYFTGSIISNLKLLGIENGNFMVNSYFVESDSPGNEFELSTKINNQNIKFFPEGIDKIEFYISTNKGESPKPLINIASGGEISRIMLAIKNVIAQSDNIKLMIFDEIDIGISGRIAQKVGQMMKNLARYKQIIAITHLPQIAAFGDLNFRVVKSESNGKTFITAEKLENQDKINEIARLISGEQITEAAIYGAKQLFEEAKNFDIVNN